MRNRYPGNCTKCNGWTAADSGDCVKSGSRWAITCDECANGVPAEDRVVLQRFTIHGYRFVGETFAIRPDVTDLHWKAREAAGDDENYDDDAAYDAAVAQANDPANVTYRTVVEAKTRRANSHDVEENEDCGDMTLRLGAPITTYVSRPATDEEITSFHAQEAAKLAEKTAEQARYTAATNLKNAPLGEDIQDQRDFRVVHIEQWTQGYGDMIRVYDDGTVALHHRNSGFDLDNWVRPIELDNALELVIAARDSSSDKAEITDEEIRALIAAR